MDLSFAIFLQDRWGNLLILQWWVQTGEVVHAMAGTLGKPAVRGDGKQSVREDLSLVKVVCSGRRRAHVMCAGSQAACRQTDKQFCGN